MGVQTLRAERMSHLQSAVPQSRPRDRWLLMRLLSAAKSQTVMADQLINERGSLGGVLRTSDERLRQIGVDTNGIAILNLLREAVGAVLDRSDDDRLVVRSGQDLAELLHGEMSWLSVEQVRVAYLDSGRRLQALEVLSTGTLRQSAIYPREIARRALELSSDAVVLAHNHPSGAEQASPEDIWITNKVREALAVLDIELVDHLIVSRTGVFSVRGALKY